MNKKLYLELQIELYLNDIKNYAEGAYQYLTNPSTVYDSDEVKEYLSCVPEIIEVVKDYIFELEKEYENEQLQ